MRPALGTRAASGGDGEQQLVNVHVHVPALNHLSLHVHLFFWKYVTTISTSTTPRGGHQSSGVYEIQPIISSNPFFLKVKLDLKRENPFPF